MRLQRILWREDLSANVDTYELTTFTYGTASASFLATRCLKHLAEQHAHQLTRGSACVLRDFFVDDMFTEADTIDELKLIRDDHSAVKISIRVKQRQGLELLWTIANRQSWLCVIIIDNAAHVFWACSGINARIRSNVSVNLIQKSTLYQNGSYFPRLLNCSILWAFWVRSLWSQNNLARFVAIDHPMGVRSSGYPHSLDCFQNTDEWFESKNFSMHLTQCSSVEPIRGSARILCRQPARVRSLHILLQAGFQWPSLQDTVFKVSCRAAQDRLVTAIRTISAALLLARLINKVKESLEFSQCPIYLIGLNDCVKLDNLPLAVVVNFVANRVDEIQRLTEIKHWRHVASSDKSADTLSRGLNPCDLINAEK